MKRIYRQLSDSTKAKISQRLKGRSKSLTHKEKISQALKQYWETIPNNPNNLNDDEK